MVTCRQLEGSLRRRFGPQVREVSHWEGGCNFYIGNPKTRASFKEEYPNLSKEAVEASTEMDVIYPCDWGKLPYLGPKICAHIPVPSEDSEAFMKNLDKTSCVFVNVYGANIEKMHVECPDYGRKGLMGLMEKSSKGGS